MKFIIYYDCGYGATREVVDCQTEDEATEWAYNNWKDEAESQAIYGVEEYTKDLAEEYDLE